MSDSSAIEPDEEWRETSDNWVIESDEECGADAI